MEIETGTRIRLPRPDDPSDIIEIIGTKEGIEVAKNKIQMKSDEMVCGCLNGREVVFVNF